MTEVASSPFERLTQGFYEWEVRGRGWFVWAEPMGLEPPFRPFLGHGVGLVPAVDDGRQHTVLSRLVERVSRILKGEERERTHFGIPPEWLENHGPEGDQDAAHCEFSAQHAGGAALSHEMLERWIVGLQLSGPASFELTGTAEAIQTGFTCREEDATYFVDSARMFLPEVVLLESPNRFASAWADLHEPECIVVDFALSNEFMLPLANPARHDPGPLSAAIAALEALSDGELGLLQILFQPTRFPWSESMLRAVRDPTGGAFFGGTPEILPLSREKTSRPLFAVVIRVAAAAPELTRAFEIARQLGGSLTQFARPGANELVPMDDQDYPAGAHEADLFRRTSHRSGMILNSSELASLVSIPHPRLASARLERLASKTRAAPKTHADGSLLGVNRHNGLESAVRLSQEARLRHVHLVGASGTGKSTLLLNLALQDIEGGRGVGLLDPHGDLVDEILGRIPESRRSDVVLVDPSDEEFAIPFNVLAAGSELERNLLASDLGAVFRRLSTSWGDQMTTVLGNAIGAILAHPDGGTLLTLRRLLADADYRKAYLAGVRDPEIVFFWAKEFPILRGGSLASILTRLNVFLRPKPLRAMVSHAENRIDFADIMDTGGIFLAKLSHGLLGAENAHLLGSLLVARFQQTAIARQARNPEERRPFNLVIDEFQNFATPSMAEILSGARKYGLGLTLAHQDLRQLDSVRELGNLLLSAGTRVCFRLGDADARSLETGFSFFGREDLQSLGRGEAIARLDRADHDFNLETLPPPPIDASVAREVRRGVEEACRRRLAVPIREWDEGSEATQAPVSEPSTPSKKPIQRSAPPVPPMPRPAEEPDRSSDHRTHTYFKRLVGRMGQDRGFRATLEESLPEGVGRVDVALARQDLRIAVEISVTSRANYEAKKAAKCFEAGFDRLVVLSPDRSGRAEVRKALPKHLGTTELEQVEVLGPEELPGFFDSLPDAEPTESLVRGYRVKVRHRSDADDLDQRRRVAEVIARSLKRLKDE